mmetsp:Transcript_13132/g.55452  ORF Transcript_13132/g.55452 Transcript_13132/m.55452 type:complete len:214 (-) Transcript_13132:85-726(-)
MRRMKRIRLTATTSPPRRLVESVSREKFVMPGSRLRRALRAPSPRRELPRALLDRRRGLVVHPHAPSHPSRSERLAAPGVPDRRLPGCPTHGGDRQIHAPRPKRRAPQLRVLERRRALALLALRVRRRSLRWRLRAGPRATSGILRGGRPGRGWRRPSQHRVNIVAARCAMRLRAASIGGVGARRRLFLRSERRIYPRSPVVRASHRRPHVPD